MYDLNVDEYDVLLDLLGYKNPEIEILNNVFVQNIDKLNKLVDNIGINTAHQKFKLILWNDDVNAIDNVSFAINDICGIENADAYKITLDDHLKGKAVIKQAKLAELIKLHKRMSDIDIKTIVNKL